MKSIATAHCWALSVLLSLASTAAAQGPQLAQAKIPAFPGAEGGGAWTAGGRGGKVFVVSNLNDAGPGSLREAVAAQGPRTIVFGVAGIIDLQSPLLIENPFVTIAGQSAPGDGVCIKGDTTEINTHDVVIRHVRFRRGNMKSRNDGLGGYPQGNVIVDHVSASWGLDENLSLYRWIKKVPGGTDLKLAVENLTVQWCVSSEAMDLNSHAFGGTWGGKNCSFHHNLFACNTGRNPSIGMGGTFDYRNNVVFNWRHRTMDGGDGSSRVNVVANYYKPGPATPADEMQYRICRAQGRNARDAFPGFGKWYVAENYVFGNPKVTANNWAGGVQYDGEERSKDLVVPAGTEAMTRSYESFPAAPVTTQSAEEAFELVMARGGAVLPRRDPVDRRVMEMVRTGKTTFKLGIIDTPFDVGGWPEYKAESVPADADRDGMPDAWEIKHGLNPQDAADSGGDKDKDGYTHIEEFLSGTDPATFVDYTQPKNNVDALLPSIER